MSDDLVSIVIPVMNPNILHLRKCLISVKNQTYPNIECVIIFDRYDDKDDEALSTIESAGITNLTIVKRKTPNGFTSALNDGIKNSLGRYIARLDSDDVCHPERISKQISYLNSTDCSLIGSWARIIDPNDMVIKLFKPPYSYKDIRNNIMKHNPFVHSSLMFKKADVQRVGSYDTNFNGSEDYELYLRMIGMGFRIENVPEILVDIRESEDSITRGEAWKRNRKMYIRSKIKAVSAYGFKRPSDIFYCCVSPMALLITAKKAMSSKSLTGWYWAPN